MWVILWRDSETGMTGALKCPGSQTQEEAQAHARALSVLFRERRFRVVWMDLTPAVALS